jgi:hypothetical protein
VEGHHPPAGWRTDPADPARERYWDGTVWTDEYRTAPTRLLGPQERVVERERVVPEEPLPAEERSGLAIWGAALGAGILGLVIGLLLGGGGDRSAETVTRTASEIQTVTRTLRQREEARTITLTVTKQAPATPPSDNGGSRSGCDPNYTGCVPTGRNNVSCSDVDGPVRVTGKDIYGLDPDGDGQACD